MPFGKPRTFLTQPVRLSMLGDKGLVSIIHTRNIERHHENSGISGTWQCYDNWGLRLSIRKDPLLEISCFVVKFRSKLKLL